MFRCEKKEEDIYATDGYIQKRNTIFEIVSSIKCIKISMKC